MWRTSVVSIAAVLALATVMSGQQRQTFRTATRLVEVSVVVTTGNGSSVKGLTQADFSLKEDGKVQPISFFDARGGTPSKGPGDESSFVIPPDSFTNVARSPTGTSTVLLLDRTNASFTSQWYAKEHIDRYLKTMPPGERVALYVLAGSVQVLHDFTTDAKALREVLDHYQARVTGDYVASTEPPSGAGAIGSWLADPGDSMSDYFMRKRAVDTFEMLEFLAEHLAGISGRKNLVWLSEAFAIPTGLDRLEVLEKMYRANKALSHAQVSVYPVDSRGLIGAYTVSGRQIIWTNLHMVRGNIDTMDIVAEETGGRTYANTNALDRSIARAVDDSRTSYVLGYYPPSSAPDGRFRRIDVKVNRQGAKVRHRLGYFSAAAQVADSGEAATREALESPLQTTAVALAAHVTARGDDRVVALKIDPSTVSLEQKDGRWHATIDVMIGQVDRLGRGVVDETVPLRLSLTDEERSRALTEGIAVTRTITQKPGVTEFRVVARDTTTGKVGSLVIPATRIR